MAKDGTITNKHKYMKTVDRLVGTELKINFGMTAMGDIHLSTCPFTLYVYTLPNKGYEITKDECIKIDDDNYLVLVDTSKTGAGTIKFKVTIDLPDADFNDLHRREVVLIDTGEQVGK